MPTLRKVKNGYHGVWYDPTRKPKRPSVTLRTTRKDIAEIRLREYDQLYAQGKWDPWNRSAKPENLTFEEAVAEFLKDRHHLRPKTLIAYRQALKDLGRCLPPNLPLSAVRPANVRPYVEARDVSADTRRHRFRHLRAFFNWAVEEGHLNETPLKGLRIPKAEKKVAQFLTPEQLERILAAIDADIELKRQEGQVMPGEIVWLKDLIIMAVGTGLRLGELCSLRWNGIDLESEFLTVRNTADFRTKSGHERRVPLAGDALEVVRRLHATRPDDRDGPVLTGYEGRPLAPTYASKRFKYYVRLARLPEHIRFHSLRHTCASWLVMRGVSLPIVQAILGHSSIQVTERYAHLAPDVVKAAMRQAFGGQ